MYIRRGINAGRDRPLPFPPFPIFHSSLTQPALNSQPQSQPQPQPQPQPPSEDTIDAVNLNVDDGGAGVTMTFVEAFDDEEDEGYGDGV
jgi:hypothetical protein